MRVKRGQKGIGDKNAQYNLPSYNKIITPNVLLKITLYGMYLLSQPK